MGWFHAAYAAGELDFDGAEGGGTCALPRKPKKVQVPPCPTTLTGVEVIYHMTEKAAWEEAIQDKVAYFPPTFHKDGKFTRASVFKEGLIDVANHFYKDTSKEEWICLELNLKYLLDMGVVVLPQPVEESTSSDNNGEDAKEEKDDSPSPVQCFQIYAGISTIPELKLVKNIYPMKRGGCGTFLALEDPKPYGLMPKPKSREDNAHKQRVEKLRADTEKIQGLGSVPAAAAKTKSRPEQSAGKTNAKPEQPAEIPKRSGSFSKGSIGKMFGIKAKK